MTAFAFAAVACALLLGANFTPTERMLRMPASAKRSIVRAHLSLKEAAYLMGIPETLLNRQLAMREGAHLSFARMGELPDEALINLAEELCDMTGIARVVRDAKVDRILRRLEDLDRLLESREGMVRRDCA